MGFPMFYSPQGSIPADFDNAGRTDGRMDGWTDGWTDIPSLRSTKVKVREKKLRIPHKKSLHLQSSWELHLWGCLKHVSRQSKRKRNIH